MAGVIGSRQPEIPGNPITLHKRLLWELEVRKFNRMDEYYSHAQKSDNEMSELRSSKFYYGAAAEDRYDDGYQDGRTSEEEATEVSEGCRETFESTVVKLTNLHSRISETLLTNYITEQTGGFVKVEQFGEESETDKITKMAIVYYDSTTAAQSAMEILSQSPLGPGGCEIKVELVHPDDDHEDNSQLPIQDPPESQIGDERSKTKQTPRRQPRKWSKNKPKKPVSNQMQEGFTVEVRNICVKKEGFEALLVHFSIKPLQPIQWKPEVNQALLCFGRQEDATFAEQKLNNCTLGGANMQLVATQQTKPIQPKGGPLQTNMPAAFGVSRPIPKGTARNVPKESGKQERNANPTGAYPKQIERKNAGNQSGTSDMPTDTNSQYVGQKYQRPRHGHSGTKNLSKPTTLPMPEEMETNEENDENTGSVVSTKSFSRKSSSLHVPNIDIRVNNEAFEQFVLQKGITNFRNIHFGTSVRQERYALIHFSNPSDSSKAKYILNNQRILPGGQRIHVTFSKYLEPPSQIQQDGHQRGWSHKGNFNKGHTRGPFIGNQQGRGRDDSDRFSECSEATSITSNQTFPRSAHPKSRPRKTSMLRVTNIGKEIDKEEFCYFLEGLDLVCECLEFTQSSTTNTNSAVIRFRDCKKATDAKSILNTNEWMLGGKTIKASFSMPKASNVRKSSTAGPLGELDEGDDRMTDVANWLTGNKASSPTQAKDTQGGKLNMEQKACGKGAPPTGFPQAFNQGGQLKRANPSSGQPVDLDTLLSTGSDKKSSPRMSLSSRPPQEHRQASPEEIVITDLPRDIAELDIVEIIQRENCKGFRNVQLTRDKDYKTRTGVCFVTFWERENAMAAVLQLYGKEIKNHRIQVKLTVNHDQIEPAIARRALNDFLDKDMPMSVEQNKTVITEKIKTIKSEKKLAKESLEENLPFREFENHESLIAALQHQQDEQKRYLNEFDKASESIRQAAVSLQTKGVTALSDVQKIRHHFERECRRARSTLPVYGFRSEIQRAIRENKAVVLQGETGSGKSTQIPQYIVDMELQASCKDGESRQEKWRVVCTQPRRVAALTLAKRVAEEYGCRVGEEIGYFVGNKKTVSPNTVVTFMTDRKLLNLIIEDPDLSCYTCVIVDEAHERSVDTDILLATLKKLLQKRDLHLLIMSATIDVKLFTDYFRGCKDLCVPGRTFPVDKYWCGNDVGIGDGDYVKRAVQHAAQVHRNEGRGDILVFLTSANEIESACRDLATNLGIHPNDEDVPVLILPLHGRLQPEDQMKVFKEPQPGQRKIVFATNIAETSITIKGIKYIIDTGVVKECQYDPKRSMSLLKVTTITKASAQQRAGRAGRTAPGVCYRLYTKEEYAELEETMKPEILRVHLGMAALQLLELGVEDVENFDFIEAPEREATRQAINTLRLLGAVDEHIKLTPLGHQMATLPLEPRLSKLVLEGIKRDLAIEAVTLAALISAPGSVFYRGGSDKDKDKSDRLKLPFCQEGGDIITMLHAYRQWNNQPEKKQKAWCLENSMNSKTLRATKETVKEVCQVLKREQSIDCSPNDEMKELEKKAETLQKIIVSGYFQSLSLYNGHQRAGYTVLPQQKTAHVHPSSALKALGSSPQWVVYEEFKRTSRDFLFNITLVSISWLEEMAPVFFRETNLVAFREMAMEEMPPIPLGNALMRQITLRRNEKLRGLEERIAAEQGSPCIIEVNRNTKQLQMFVNKGCCSYAISSVKCFLEEERKMVERQQVEVPVGDSGVVRQVVIAGAETRFILMAKDYRTLEISNMPVDTTEDDIERIVRFAGCSEEEILDVYKFPKQTSMAKACKWGRVTFISPEAAKDAKEWLDAALAAEETTLSVRALQGRGFQRPDIRRVNTRVVVTWYTWPSKGIAFVNCSSTENAVALLNDILLLELRDTMIRCQLKRDDTRAIYIRNVDKNATQEELEKAIRDMTSVPFNRCSIPRAEPTGPIPTPDIVTRDIYSMFEGAVQEQNMNIDVLEPRSERSQMHKAIVTFSGDSEGPVDTRVAQLQTNPKFSITGQMYHVKVTASCLLFCRPEIYSCLEEEIESLIQTAKEESKDLNIRVNESRKTSDQVISIASGKIEEVQKVRQSLLKYIQGETVPFHVLHKEEITFQKRIRVLEILRSGMGHLLNDLEAHAMVDGRRQVVVIFGNDTVRKRAQKRFTDYVGIICNNMLREISLTSGQSGHTTKGRVIRALVKAYGPWLTKLQEDSGAKQITLNMRHGVLLVEAVQPPIFATVERMVSDCLEEAGLEIVVSADATESTIEDVECGICYTSVEEHGEVYRLSACSHGFHETCLKEMFAVRLKDASKDYPIECPYESCGAAVFLCDIRILCPDEDKRLLLYQWALEAYVTQKCNGQLKFCPMADCKMVYRPTGDAQTFVCPECRSRICSSCGSEPHSGQTCEEYKISSKSFEDIEQWMKASGMDVKKCPTPDCGAVIERVEGCNYMACTQCHKHICWICLEFFESDEMCYTHLTEKHGGCF